MRPLPLEWLEVTIIDRDPPVKALIRMVEILWFAEAAPPEEGVKIFFKDPMMDTARVKGSIADIHAALNASGD